MQRNWELIKPKLNIALPPKQRQEAIIDTHLNFNGDVMSWVCVTQAMGDSELARIVFVSTTLGHIIEWRLP